MKNFPLPMHSYSRKAATAAMAAARQGKFKEFSHKLFASQSSLSDDTVQSIAKELNLDMDKFNRDLKDPEIQTLINRDIEEGTQAEVPGTPTLFINGKHVELRSGQDVDNAITAELKKGK